MNTYKKYCPNVFVAQCEEQHQKGDEILVTTKYGKENKSIVHNFVGYTGTKENPMYCYSIVRSDGFNSQERAKKKAEKLSGYAHNAKERSDNYYEASQEGKDFLSLGEPIKVGHHSEKRHRALIERNHKRMGKFIEESDKAEQYQRRAKYWDSMTDKIDLSIPESIDYFKFKYDEAVKHHKYLKDNPDKREHSYSLTYANKAKKDLKKKYETAIKLWGNEPTNEENKEPKKISKSEQVDKAIQKYGIFFAFNNDQFKDGFNKLLEDGYLEKGEKVVSIGAGGYVPSKNIDKFKNAIQ